MVCCHCRPRASFSEEASKACCDTGEIVPNQMSADVCLVVANGLCGFLRHLGLPLHLPLFLGVLRRVMFDIHAPIQYTRRDTTILLMCRRERMPQCNYEMLLLILHLSCNRYLFSSAISP